MQRSLGLGLLAALVALPGSATASTQFGASLGANANLSPFCPTVAAPDCSAVLGGAPVGERATSPMTGVVTAWRTRAAINSNVTFQVVRETGTKYRVLASDTRAAQQNTVNEFLVRIPIREGDRLGLNAPGSAEPLRTAASSSALRFEPPLGSSDTSPAENFAGAVLLVNATVEEDADGDGFGDDTQDDCPTNPLSQGACSGTLVGPLLNGDSQWTGSLMVIDPATLANGDKASPDGSRIPSDGVIVRWRIRSAAGGWAPQVVRPEEGGRHRSVAIGARVEVAAANDNSSSPPYIRSFPTRLPVKAGDIFGVKADALSQTTSKQAGPLLIFTPPLGDGESGTGGAALFLLAVNADLEPDADGDGFGDITQDACPQSAATQVSCPPPPPVRLDPFGVADLLGKRLRYRGGRVLRIPVRCPASAERCGGLLEARANVRRRKAAASRIVRLGRVRFSIPGGQKRTLSLRLSRPARRALASARRVRVTMAITPSGPGGVRRSVLVLRGSPRR